MCEPSPAPPAALRTLRARGDDTATLRVAITGCDSSQS